MKVRLSHLNWILISVGIAVGLWLRLWYLNAVPAAFYHDEMDYVLTGQSIVRWGTDLSGAWNPFQLKPLRTLNITGELPAVFHALTQFFAGGSVGAARLTNALFGIGTIILTAMLSIIVSGKKQVGLWVGLIMLLNPWHVHISRLGYEAAISVFFQVLLIHGLIRILPIPPSKDAFSHNRQAVWTIITLLSMFFGYYTYHGAKFTIISIVGIYLFWWSLQSYRHVKKHLFTLASILTLLIMLVSHSLWLNHTGAYGWRSSSEIYTVDTAANLVNQERRDRIPFATDAVVVNKYTVALGEIIKRYWFVFDLNRLLMTGYEGGYQFSLLVSGYFGLIELIGIMLCLRFIKTRPHLSVITLILVISPLTTVISGYQALLRSALTYVLLILFAGWGIHAGLEKIKYKLIGPVVLLWMIGSSLWFGLQYFAKYPLLTAENHMLSERLIARYVRSASQPVTILVDLSSYNTARSIIFYNQWYSKLSPNERAQFNHPFPATIQVGQVTVTTECPTSLSNTPIAATINKWKACGFENTYQNFANKSLTGLPSPLDNGDYYVLWNNYLCGNSGKSFIHLKNLSELGIENMSDDQFCQTWIKKG